jgi:hypothetical protein
MKMAVFSKEIGSGINTDETKVCVTFQETRICKRNHKISRPITILNKNIVVLRTQEMLTTFRWEISVLLGSSYLEGREVDGSVRLRWILGKCVIKIGGGWNWLRIVSKGRL